ncbi:hypothetical protein QOT17_003351 [Balamuthia mandrillaris]
MQFIEDGVSRLRRSRNTVLVVVTLAALLDTVAYTVVVPLIPLYVEMLRISNFQLAVLLSAFPIAGLPLQPVVGLLSDVCGRKWPMVIGFVSMAVSTVMYCLVQSFPLLFITRTFQGISSAFTWTVGLATLADIYRPHELSHAMGIANAASSIGGILGGPFGGLMYDWGGIMMPFVVIGVLCLVDGFARLYLLDIDTIKAIYNPSSPSEKEDEEALLTSSLPEKEDEKEDAATIVQESHTSNREMRRINRPSKTSTAVTEDRDFEEVTQKSGILSADEEEDPEDLSSKPQGFLPRVSSTTSSSSSSSHHRSPQNIVSSNVRWYNPSSYRYHPLVARWWRAFLLWWRGPLATLLNKAFLLTLFATMMGGAVVTLLEVLLPIHFVEVYQASSEIGFFFGVMAVAYSVCSVAAGWLVDKGKCTNYSAIILGWLLSVVALPLLALAPSMFLSFATAIDENGGQVMEDEDGDVEKQRMWQRTMSMALDAVVLFIIAVGHSFATTPVMAFLSEVSTATDPNAEKNRGIMYGLYTSAYTAGMIVGPLYVGILLDLVTEFWRILVVLSVSTFAFLLVFVIYFKQAFEQSRIGGKRIPGL